MKLERKHKLRIIMAIAVLLILYGVLDGIFGFNIDPKVVSNVSFVLMMIAFVLLFSGRGKKDDTINKTDDIIVEDNPNQTEIDSSVQDTSKLEESNPVQEDPVEESDDTSTK